MACTDNVVLRYLIHLDLGAGRPDVGVEDLGTELVPAAAGAVAQLLHGHPEAHQPLRVHGLQEQRQISPPGHALHHRVQRQTLERHTTCDSRLEEIS